MKRVAVFDLGKTHARVVLCDLERGREAGVRRMRNAIRPGPPYPHHDLEAQESFLLSALRDFAAEGPIDALLPVAHGATMALTDGRALVFPVLDYEHDGPDQVAAAYDATRPPFAVTGTPRMGQGLNLGAQLHWLRHLWPADFARVTQALTWPQYWSWRLSGVAASEVAYLSGHGDLWDLQRAEPLGLVRGLLPPLRRAGEALGPIRPELGAGLTILNGAHDSSLALLPHGAGPCTVLSTGTWITGFALGCRRMPEPQGSAVMASLDIDGALVPNFRIMAGRAFDLLSAPGTGLPLLPPEALTLSEDFRLQDRQGAPAELIPGDRPAQLGAILARLTLEGLARIGASGPLHLQGPFAENPGFLATLQEGWPDQVTRKAYADSLFEQVASLLRPALDGP